MYEIKSNKNGVHSWKKLDETIFDTSEESSREEAKPKTKKIKKEKQIKKEEYSPIEIDCEEISYPSRQVLNIEDHLINQKELSIAYAKNELHSHLEKKTQDLTKVVMLHPAYFIYSSSTDDEYDSPKIKEYVKELKKMFESLAPIMKVKHPGGKGTVWDLIHPSCYPFIEGKSKGYDGKVFQTPKRLQTHLKKRRKYFYLSDNFFKMEPSPMKWLPTVYHVTQESSIYKVEQKSYINGLFIDEENKSKIEHLFQNIFGYAFGMMETLYNDMTKESLLDRDLQVIIKSAYYELEPGSSHEDTRC